MSIRWIAVQYVGDMLRLPVVNEGDMDKPFGSSVVDRKISRAVINPFSDNPQTFVPESENAKLRELVKLTYAFLAWADGATFSDGTPAVHASDRREVEDRMRELGIDADGVTMARLRFDRTAPRVIVADGDTDCATGHCECGGCGGAIDCWDRFCKHCGAKLED